MNLISCSKCGIVVDGDKLYFPVDIYNDDSIVDEEYVAWNGRDFVPKVKCPVCSGDILRPQISGTWTGN